MNKKEKVLYALERHELIKSAVITGGMLKATGEDVHLIELKVTKANGDEFVIKPLGTELTVIQTG